MKNFADFTHKKPLVFVKTQAVTCRVQLVAPPNNGKNNGATSCTLRKMHNA